MMRPRQRIESPSGLRTRYFPRNRIGQGLLSAAPWVDIVLVVLFFVLLNSQIVLQPGLVVDLPSAPFRAGRRPGFRAVVLSVRSISGSGREEVLFFDDVRYIVRQEKQMQNFKRTLTDRLRRNPGAELVIEADRRVTHGTVVDIVTMAQEAGIRQVNVAQRPE